MVVDKILFLVQKPIQLAIYLYLRHTIPRLFYRENAHFYLRIISFFNLIEWVDSQVNVDDDLQLSRVQDNSGWSDVMLVTSKALIIDYRLLCCLLFLEHSLELQTCDYGNVAGEGVGLNDGTTNDNMTDGDGIKMCSDFLLALLGSLPQYFVVFIIYTMYRSELQYRYLQLLSTQQSSFSVFVCCRRTVWR